MTFRRSIPVGLFAGLLAIASPGAQQQTPPLTPDIPAQFDAPTAAYDYVKRVVMIPMRDGVKLYTVIVVPKGARNAPILLTRTPYNAAGARAAQSIAAHARDAAAVRRGVRRRRLHPRLPGRARQVRIGRRLRDDAAAARTAERQHVDHSTDAYDTIDWLVKNVPESNGRVGMLGSSYEGFTVVMALVNPHPALKVAAPESPMVDGWMGDDWFHYGAFRQLEPRLLHRQTTARGAGADIARQGYDDYDNFRRAGSAGDFAKAAGLDQLPVVAQDHRASRLRRVLAGAGARHDRWPRSR